MQTRETLSHTLRTPLTSLKLIIDLCLRRRDSISEDQRNEFLGMAMQQVERLERAILAAEGDATVLEEKNVVVVTEESVEGHASP